MHEILADRFRCSAFRSSSSAFGTNRPCTFADNALAGFVLVNEYYYISKGAKTIAEFFVLKKYRRQGIGEEAAKQVFNLFPGRWEIGELRGNKNAQSFWRKIIGDYTKGNYKEIELDNERWHGPIQTFDAGNSG